MTTRAERKKLWGRRGGRALVWETFEAMEKRFAGDETFHTIGQSFGVTREAIRALWKRYFLDSTGPVRARSRVMRITSARNYRLESILKPAGSALIVAKAATRDGCTTRGVRRHIHGEPSASRRWTYINGHLCHVLSAARPVSMSVGCITDYFHFEIRTLGISPGRPCHHVFLCGSFDAPTLFVVPSEMVGPGSIYVPDRPPSGYRGAVPRLDFWRDYREQWPPLMTEMPATGHEDCLIVDDGPPRTMPQ